METKITKQDDITITERTIADEPGMRSGTPFRLDASRETAAVFVEVSFNGEYYKVRRGENRGAGWTRTKFSHHVGLDFAIAAARDHHERQLNWLRKITPIAGRKVDAVNL